MCVCVFFVQQHCVVAKVQEDLKANISGSPNQSLEHLPASGSDPAEQKVECSPFSFKQKLLGSIQSLHSEKVPGFTPDPFQDPNMQISLITDSKLPPM